MLFSICMCTYKREHLRNTLESISNLVLPETSTVEVLVVDNDELKSAMKIVESLKNTYPFALRYFNEPRKNISIARNKYLKEAKGEWIASLDDDEIADKKWLLELFNSAVKFQADIVFGNVKPIYPRETPDWILEGGFFERKRSVTGTQVSSGGAGCTLMKSCLLKDTGFLFDEAYGLSGGEDAELYHRFYKEGYKLITCDEAWVNEEVEPNRMCIEFLVNRKIRVGSSFTKYRYQNKAFSKKALYFLKNTIFLGIEALVMMLSYPLSKVHHYKWLLKSADRYGKLKYFFQKRLQDLY